MMPWAVEICSQQFALKAFVALGQDFDTRGADTIMLVLKAIVGASDIPVLTHSCFVGSGRRLEAA